jgi:hypothetical protein
MAIPSHQGKGLRNRISSNRTITLMLACPTDVIVAAIPSGLVLQGFIRCLVPDLDVWTELSSDRGDLTERPTDGLFPFPTFSHGWPLFPFGQRHGRQVSSHRSQQQHISLYFNLIPTSLHSHQHVQMYSHQHVQMYSHQHVQMSSTAVTPASELKKGK